MVGDVSVAEDAQTLAAKVFALGPLKVAVFNAAGWIRGTALELTPEQFEAAWCGGTREYGPQGLHVAHIVIDGIINGERIQRAAPALADQAGADGLLSPDAIAGTYFQLHLQPRNAWTHELDLRPYKESF
jgi:hypothetical protein